MSEFTRRFTKLRELVTLARNLEREARKMRPGGEGRTARMAEAEGYRVKALWIAGRITDGQYEEYLTHGL
jgi:hypothetical protein